MFELLVNPLDNQVLGTKEITKMKKMLLFFYPMAYFFLKILYYHVKLLCTIIGFDVTFTYMCLHTCIPIKLTLLLSLVLHSTHHLLN